ncbi:MAG: UDP-N-acetylmuramoyl-tripeptide--D-alanyl-D-alanine ligase [Gammaproteobacteria bacterium]|nr:UDP-N-acetylmuramoyl-tripeptide--D-alanyl-D-alanine ligase [Gammaproteobacteria bacterium]
MPRTLAGVAEAVRGRLVGGDAPFGVVGTDTRDLLPGALFVAIRGERHDGNRFVAEAAAKGAAGALVSALAQTPLPQVEVPDTRAALGTMANAWRCNFRIPVIAITGSSGKTTVKELTASIVGIGRSVCVTQGNLNNDIGVPLTLMRLTDQHDIAVVELGANHAGEIDYLGRLAEPTVGVITNAGAAHLEGFGSVAGVAAAKGELLDRLPRAGTAVLNADDRFVPEWRSRARSGNVITFGFAAEADVTVVGEPKLGAAGSSFTLRLPDGETVAADLPLLGRQNVANALAAAAAAYAVGAGPEQIGAGLARAAAVHGRMRTLRGRIGATIVDDSYNANPSSARAALDYLAALGGHRIFVLGDMFELGPDAAALHREVGEYARGRCDVLVAVGKLAREAAAAYGDPAEVCDDIDAAVGTVTPMLGADTTVLVKASRGMGLDRLVDALEEPSGREGSPC